MSYTRLYRYKIRPECLPDFSALCEKTKALYEQHGIKVLFIMQDGQGGIIDASVADSKEDYAAKQEILDSHPEIEKLFAEFKTMQVPDTEIVTEEFFSL